MTNSTWVDLTKPNAPVWHFLSNFLYADFIINNQIKTPSARLPINLLLEYENNLNAADHPFDTHRTQRLYTRIQSRWSSPAHRASRRSTPAWANNPTGI